MNMIKVSNIMGIDRKQFDPKTYVEEDTFVTDESGTKKRIRLENNIVRWRKVRNSDGRVSVSDYSNLLYVHIYLSEYTSHVCIRKIFAHLITYVTTYAFTYVVCSLNFS